MVDRETQLYEIVANLKSVQKNFKTRMHNHFQHMNLTAPQGMLIYMVNRHGSLKISELSKHLGLSNSTVSGIVDRLESQDLVVRERSETDRRVVNVVLTAKMKDQLKDHENVINDLMTKALVVGSDEEISQVHKGLEILNNLLIKSIEGESN